MTTTRGLFSRSPPAVRWLCGLAWAGCALAQAETGAAADPGRTTVEAVFTRLDTNGDGRLSRDEVARLPAIATKFDLLDTDHDGLLSPDEFTVGFNSPP
jgi:hypothetical protein